MYALKNELENAEIKNKPEKTESDNMDNQNIVTNVELKEKTRTVNYLDYIDEN